MKAVGKRHSSRCSATAGGASAPGEGFVDRRAAEPIAMTEDTPLEAVLTADTDRALSPVPLMQLTTGFWAFKIDGFDSWDGGWPGH